MIHAVRRLTYAVELLFGFDHFVPGPLQDVAQVH